eukprot:TRINITY_DN31639_c0_g1_i1.p1 TRINITY_DN31639_c0_g1~~TRINITY_DN31639_c0_g1_i1.p1  ORF type:complete len:100 (-),score=4.09 TRINITY_DN31639_c0_g1_i1:156-455(-)
MLIMSGYHSGSALSGNGTIFEHPLAFSISLFHLAEVPSTPSVYNSARWYSFDKPHSSHKVPPYLPVFSERSARFFGQNPSSVKRAQKEVMECCQTPSCC